MKARRGFADREQRYSGHQGDRGGLTEEDIRRKVAKGWADRLSPAHRDLAVRRDWIKP